MKYIIGAILGFMLGAGVEFEIGSIPRRAVLMQTRNAYGCGLLAATKDAIKSLEPNAKIEPEQPWCAEYRKLWDAK